MTAWCYSIFFECQSGTLFFNHLSYVKQGTRKYVICSRFSILHVNTNLLQYQLLASLYNLYFCSVPYKLWYCISVATCSLRLPIFKTQQHNYSHLLFVSFVYLQTKTPSLRKLAKQLLNISIQEGEHSSVSIHGVNTFCSIRKRLGMKSGAGNQSFNPKE